MIEMSLVLLTGVAAGVLGRRLSRVVSQVPGRSVGMSPRAVLTGQFLIAAYGGYFGGAIGILMMALWSIGLDTAVGNPMRITQLAAVFLISGVLFLFTSDALRAPLLLAALLVGATAGASPAPTWPAAFPPGCCGTSSWRPPR
ncbi:hypothetical protein [Streptomyces sp. WAC05858]|uniref:hypothetical protein n=1 Tax=Streptomyces TaxID=1883 RepID=UPI0028B231FA|nr:hypothetical protein [Streptomyces sp. WAC05858]